MAAMKKNSPITIKEVLSLESLGINEKFITSTHVTMESEKYICIRETSPQNSVVIVDMTMPTQPLRLPITADSVLMNPDARILALKAQIPGMTTQDHMDMFDMEAKTRMKSCQMLEQVVFWKWITPKMLGLVTQKSVYHWSIEGESAPVKMFDRTANLANNMIVSYRCDSSENWLVLIGISVGSPERPQLLKGNMQLFSVEQQRSQALEAHAATFCTFKVSGNDNPSTLICFASKTINAGQITSKLHVIELGSHLGNSSFGKKQNDILYPPDFQDDFPVAVQISQKYGLIYVITKLGLIYVFDLETVAAVYRNRISAYAYIIFLTTEATASGGFYAINGKGQVLLTNVNDAAIVSFVSEQLNNVELALNLATRANLSGTEKLVFKKFEDLFAQMKYKEAAELAAESPQGLLRTPETVAKFQNVLVGSETHPLLQYFAMLLTKGKLNYYESLELSRLVVNQNKKSLLDEWLAEDKLECSEELGDLVKTVDKDLALDIYIKARATPKVVAAFAERREFDKILTYLKQVISGDEQQLEALCPPEEIEKELAYARSELERYKKLNENLLKEINELREIEQSLRAETETRRQAERLLKNKNSEVHNLQKSQREMFDEIEKLKNQNAELQDERDKIVGNLEEFRVWIEGLIGSSSSRLAMANYFTEFTYEELQAATNSFNESYKIGEGGYGMVYKAYLRHTAVAIKIQRRENRNGEREFNQEVEILSRVRHPNCVMLIGACTEALALIYELMPNGSLQDALHSQKHSRILTWKIRLRIAADICSALIFLHSAKPHGIVHGDLKSANILLDLNYNSKLSDFGICRQLYQTDARATAHHCTEYPKGTLPYMDPEYLSTGELTSHYDVFSYGIVLLELVTGKDAKGLRTSVTNLLQNGKQFVDPSAGKWPLEEAMKMVHLGLRCSDPARVNRPDLAKEVWVEIESMRRASLRF